MPVHTYVAKISWQRKGAKFSDRRYSRGHHWFFDGGVKVLASSSPQIVPEPHSIAAAVDPEEALVASASSCHMLCFLSFAAGRGFVVDSYVDEASGVMDKDSTGQLAFKEITLRPQVRFSGEKQPSNEDLAALHRAAHAECYIANSLRCGVRVEAG